MVSQPAARRRRTPDFYAGHDYVAGDSVGYLLHQVVTSMRRHIEQAMAVHDLTAAQWLPLWQLARDGACSAQQLARDVDIDAGAATRLVGRLVAKGLVERQRAPSDRRVVMLQLTPAGQAVAAHIPQALAEVNNAYLRGFSHDDWQQLKALLRRMLEQDAARTGAAR